MCSNIQNGYSIEFLLAMTFFEEILYTYKKALNGFVLSGRDIAYQHIIGTNNCSYLQNYDELRSE